MEYFLDAFKYKYAQFDGRARRKEYWQFYLFYVIAIFVLLGIDMAVFGFPALYIVGILAALIPTFAITVRRLHDTNKSGWSMLISLIPIIGSIILIVYLCTDGTPGENIYGSNPKEIDQGVTSHLIEEDTV